MALRFSHEHFYYRTLRRHRMALSIAIAIFLGVIIAGVVIFVFFWHNRGHNSAPVASAKGKTTNYDPFLTFQSPYFSFQTDKKWQAEPAESNANTYVYRAFQGTLVERDLAVYVNTLPTNLMLTYVLPLQVQGNRFTTQAISDHCRNYVPPAFLAHSRNPTTVTVQGVSFTCQTDGTSVTIGSGVVGGSYQATMVRQNGGAAQYFLLYHDLAFNPRSEIFKAIVDSFQSH